MQSNASDIFEKRNTCFVLQFKPSLQTKTLLQQNSNNIQHPALFEDDRDYACIPNIQNNTVYLSETTYSGKLLNTHSKLRDENSNKFLFASSSEKYEFDKVYSDRYK